MKYIRHTQVLYDPHRQLVQLDSIVFNSSIESEAVAGPAHDEYDSVVES